MDEETKSRGEILGEKIGNKYNENYPEGLKPVFSERFKDMTRSHELKMREIAEALHFVDKTVYNWGNGSALPDLETLIRLSYMFDDVDPGYLLGTQREESSRRRAAAAYTHFSEKTVKRIRKLSASQRGALETLIRGGLWWLDSVDPTDCPEIREDDISLTPELPQEKTTKEVNELLDRLAGVLDQRRRVIAAEAAVRADLRAIDREEDQGDARAALERHLSELQIILESQAAERYQLATCFSHLVDQISPAADRPTDLIREAQAALDPVRDFAQEEADRARVLAPEFEDDDQEDDEE